MDAIMDIIIVLFWAYVLCIIGHAALAASRQPAPPKPPPLVRYTPKRMAFWSALTLLSAVVLWWRL